MELKTPRNRAENRGIHLPPKGLTAAPEQISISGPGVHCLISTTLGGKTSTIQCQKNPEITQKTEEFYLPPNGLAATPEEIPFQDGAPKKVQFRTWLRFRISTPYKLATSAENRTLPNFHHVWRHNLRHSDLCQTKEFFRVFGFSGSPLIYPIETPPPQVGTIPPRARKHPLHHKVQINPQGDGDETGDVSTYRVFNVLPEQH